MSILKNVYAVVIVSRKHIIRFFVALYACFISQSFWSPFNVPDAVQVAEEVVYPDFAIRSPWYVLSEHAEVIERHLHVRFRKERRHGKGPNWFYYLNQHGRNFVFINTTYHPGQLPIAWTPNGGHCMGGKPAEPLKIVQPNTRFGNGDVHASLMFAASPDSYSFQHWSDRVAMMLVQTERHRSNTTKYIAMPPR